MPPGRQAGRDGSAREATTVGAAAIAADDEERRAHRARGRRRGSRAARCARRDQRGSETGPGAGTRQRSCPSATCTATSPVPEASTAFVPCGERSPSLAGPSARTRPRALTAVGDAAPEREHDAAVDLDGRERRAHLARGVVLAQVAGDGDRADGQQRGQQRASRAAGCGHAGGARARARRRPRARAGARARRPRSRPAPRSPAGAPRSSCSPAFTSRPSRRARRAPAAGAS